MPSIPVIAFSAWSGTGKTTIIEQLIPLLKQAGLRVAAVKHDAHDFEIDREGKDSWRFTNAGADVTVIQSQTKTALIEQRSLSLSDVLSRIHDVDVILAEGYNDLPLTPCYHDLPRPSVSVDDSAADFIEASARSAADGFRFYRVGISRLSTGKGLRTPASDCIAIITDDPDLTVPAETKVFALNDIPGVAVFLLDILDLLSS